MNRFTFQGVARLTNPYDFDDGSEMDYIPYELDTDEYEIAQFVAEKNTQLDDIVIEWLLDDEDDDDDDDDDDDEDDDDDDDDDKFTARPETNPRSVVNASLAKPVNHGMRWTNDEDIQLANFYNRGLSIDYLASSFGRTDTAILARLAWYCFDVKGVDTKTVLEGDALNAGKPWDFKSTQILEYLWSSEESLVEIARVTRRNVNAVALQLIRMHLPVAEVPSVKDSTSSAKTNSGFRAWSKDDVQRLKNAVRGRTPLATIAEDLDRSIGACVAKLISMGEITSSDIDRILLTIDFPEPEFP